MLFSPLIRVFFRLLSQFHALEMRAYVAIGATSWPTEEYQFTSCVAYPEPQSGLIADTSVE